MVLAVMVLAVMVLSDGAKPKAVRSISAEQLGSQRTMTRTPS